MGIFANLFKRKPVASLDSVSFETASYGFQGEADGSRTWATPEGDGIVLYFFQMPPDLPSAVSIEQLQESYRVQFTDDRIKFVEFGIPELDGLQCIWMVLKAPRQPHGMTYMGSLTIPFAEFSYVVKMQCEERGMTGMREAVLLLKGQQDGTVTLGEGGKLFGDWNPDDERHDATFPDHPISRLRREFTKLKQSLRVDERVKAEKRFDLPN